MELADILTTVPVKLHRNGVFEGLGLLSHKSPNLLVALYDRKALKALRNNPHISCVLTTDDLKDEVSDHVGVVTSADPLRDFYGLHEHLAATRFYWKSFATQIDPKANIHPKAYIAERDVIIGPGCQVGANVSILERSVLGEGVIIRAGTVIGGEGFEFKQISGKQWIAISHAGGVKIEDGAELQQQCAVDRPVFGGMTVVGAGTKCDNFVHIAHNVIVGKRCRIAASAMIAGSVTIGDDVWIGPSSAISSEVSIGDGAAVTIGSVVTRDVPAGRRVTGNFAIEHSRFMAFLKSIR